jgi:hypothetical protein
MNLSAKLFKFFGWMTAVGKTMQNDLNSSLFQGPYFIVYIYDSPVVRRIGNVEGNDM